MRPLSPITTMKYTGIQNRRARLNGTSARRGILLGAAIAGCFQLLRAESVDSELLLLVDTSNGGISNQEFTQLMDGYATTFTSSSMLDSIQSGAFGRIAVSLMLYGGNNTPSVGIPWMMIGNISQANQFADLVRTINRPSSPGNPNIAAALVAATLHFGDETGGVANGFESQVQVIEIAASKSQPPPTAAGAGTSSSGSLASGVDLINVLALGGQSAAIEQFYAANVIGSTIDGVAPTSTSSGFNAALASTMGGILGGTVETGALVSVNAVPEPSAVFGLIPATLLVLRRRRR